MRLRARLPAVMLSGLLASGLLAACSAQDEETDQPTADTPATATAEASTTPAKAAPKAVPSEIPDESLIEPPRKQKPADEQDLAALRLRRKAESVAATFRRQKRPAPIRVTGVTTRWQPGASYQGYFADPDLVRDGDRWYAFATNTSHLHLPTLTSTDLTTWRPAVDANGQRYDALPRVGDWVQNRQGGGGLWAPSVARIGGGWTAAYSAQFTTLGGERNNCIGLARAPRPGGPYRHLGEPVACAPESRQGVIDPDLYLDPSGKPWLTWKFSGVHNRRPAGIFSRQLRRDGTGFAAGSQIYEILTLAGGWEGNTIENPSLVQFRGVTYLFYSAHAYRGTDYATGYAVCEGPTGPCVRPSPDPLLSTATTGHLGPGGADAFVHDRSLRLIYHAWEPGQVGQLRRMRIAGLFQREDLSLELVDAG